MIPVLWRHFALEAAMMGRQTDDQGHLFYDFRLDEAVPALRLINSTWQSEIASAEKACSSPTSTPNMSLGR